MENRTIESAAQGWVECRVGDFHLEVHWEVLPGEVLVLFGPSGAGKSTTLRAVAGLLRPVKGHVEIGGKSCMTTKTASGSPRTNGGLAI